MFQEISRDAVLSPQSLEEIRLHYMVCLWLNFGFSCLNQELGFRVFGEVMVP